MKFENNKRRFLKFSAETHRPLSFFPLKSVLKLKVLSTLSFYDLTIEKDKCDRKAPEKKDNP